MVTWVVNDFRTMIPGSETLWGDLLSWIPGAVWVGDHDYRDLAWWIEERRDKPDLIIRNGTYFRPLRFNCPQIALIQDIMPMDSHAGPDFTKSSQVDVWRSTPMRAMQIGVCRQAALTVFNTEFTRSHYPELHDRPYRIIPLPVDFDLFRPMPEIEKVSDICWIGAKSHIKGYDILVELIRDTDFTFTLIMKDDIHIEHPRVRTFNKVPHADLPAIINSCRVGLCTSRVETQHLAGIEMGACGLPVVSTNVGIYWNRTAGDWGSRTNYSDKLAVEIRENMREIIIDPHAYWLGQGVDRSSCRKAWLEVVEWAT